MAVKTLSYQRWREMIEDAESGSADSSTVPNGFSPGGAAAELGVSRETIHRAIKRGTLDAYMVPMPGGRPGMYFITPEALAAFAKRPHRAPALAGLRR
jgi:excisionase family DNA binding protein